MKKMIKSGHEVIQDFVAEIQNIPTADPEIISMFIGLYQNNKLTERSIQTAVDQFIQHKMTNDDE